MTKQTKGFCKYCRKEYTRTGMIRHLAACKEKENLFALAKEEVKYYELVLYGKYNKDYWLIVQVKENATLEDLDQFIRDIWVECCGHLSAFEICGQRYESNPSEDFFGEELAKSMNCKLKKVLERGMQMEYDYDYGSTTELVIRVQDYYNAPDQKEEITILSRNNPPRFVCSVCGENDAAWVDPEGFYDGTPFFCEECLQKLEEGNIELDQECDFVPEFLLPVCNSPRMGVCGYEGSDCYPDQFEP